MSEQQPEHDVGGIGPVVAAPAVPTPETTAVTAQTEVESPTLAPDQEETAPKADAPKIDAKDHAPKADKVEPRFPGKVMIMSPGGRSWDSHAEAPMPDAEAVSAAAPGKRRMAAMAAVVALATVAGALGGAFATAGLGLAGPGHPAADADTNAAAKTAALDASVARIEADIVALKAGVEHTAKTGLSQFNKTSDRLDKVEKAQAEPAAKLARLSEAMDKLRATPAPALAASPPNEVTGSVTPLPPAPAAPKAEVARLPTVEGWVLRDVANGGALIEGRQGVFEVYAGDPVPGLGRVDAIRRQDGRWVVVTTKGLVVAR